MLGAAGLAAPAGEHRLIRIARAALLTSATLYAAACTPTVRVEAPSEPITINLNIKLDADVRLRVEEKAKEDVKSKPIF
jgi:YnbE-like lipoprotein